MIFDSKRITNHIWQNYSKSSILRLDDSELKQLVDDRCNEFAFNMLAGQQDAYIVYPIQLACPIENMDDFTRKVNTSCEELIARAIEDLKKCKHQVYLKLKEHQEENKPNPFN